MTRLQADLLLLLTAVIWGGAFVAQKQAMAHMGPFTFIAARFLISALIVLPLALREKTEGAPKKDLFLLCIAFIAGVILQQVGIERTSVTNAGFLTGLYVVFVPMICLFLYRKKLPIRIVPAAGLAIAGVWLLSGGATAMMQSVGDILVLLCAAGFAFQVVLVGHVMEKWKSPMKVCALQYAAVAAVSLATALFVEAPSLAQLKTALWPVLYAGVVSGGIAYTLQVVAQQYTPPSDSAVLLSAESVFAALFGWMIVNDSLSAMGWAGCALIMTAIAIVELWPKSLHRPA